MQDLISVIVPVYKVEKILKALCGFDPCTDLSLSGSDPGR